SAFISGEGSFLLLLVLFLFLTKLPNYQTTKLPNRRRIVLACAGELLKSSIMLILSIDTSGKSGGISLAQGDRNSFRILDSSPIAGGTFSAQLVPTLSSLLQKHGLAAKDIE